MAFFTGWTCLGSGICIVLCFAKYFRVKIGYEVEKGKNVDKRNGEMKIVFLGCIKSTSVFRWIMIEMHNLFPGKC